MLDDGVQPIHTGRELIARPSLSELRGKPVLSFFPALCSVRSEISAIRFQTYRQAPGLSERLARTFTSVQQGLRDSAVSLRNATGVPFWDALLALSMQQATLDERFIESALAHDMNPNEEEMLVSAAEISAENLSGIISTLRSGYGLAACSLVRLNSNDTAHIPMLDFRCPCNEQNAKAIEKMLLLMGHAEGILVESGHSYHFYGTSLLSHVEWVRFMGRALLFAPVVDSRFVGHRLVDGQCRLKVNDPTNGLIPRIATTFSCDQ
jgi:hypothetical protein